MREDDIENLRKANKKEKSNNINVDKKASFKSQLMRDCLKSSNRNESKHNIIIQLLRHQKNYYLTYISE